MKTSEQWVAPPNGETPSYGEQRLNIPDCFFIGGRETRNPASFEERGGPINLSQGIFGEFLFTKKKHIGGLSPHWNSLLKPEGGPKGKTVAFKGSSGSRRKNF